MLTDYSLSNEKFLQHEDLSIALPRNVNTDTLAQLVYQTKSIVAFWFN